MHDLEKAADVLKAHSMDCNEVNEDGLHVGINEALNLALYITSTSNRIAEVCVCFFLGCSIIMYYSGVRG